MKRFNQYQNWILIAVLMGGSLAGGRAIAQSRHSVPAGAPPASNLNAVSDSPPASAVPLTALRLSSSRQSRQS